MRKILVLAMVALLVVAFAVSSFPAETTFSGNYRIRAIMDYNFEKSGFVIWAGPSIVATGADKVSTNYFDQRFRFTITHTRSEFLKAVVSLDLVEDVWGQGRAMYMNNVPDDTGFMNEGYIREAYIQALTPIGLFTVGRKDGRWGMGLWSDSGGTANDSIGWAAKVGDVAFGLTYIHYRDNVMDALNLYAGYPAGTIKAFDPHNWFNAAGGGSTLGGTDSPFYDKALQSYVLYVVYLTDNVKAGLLTQFIWDPATIWGAYLIKHVAGFSHFAGELPNEHPSNPGFLGIVPGGHWPASPASLGGVAGFGRMGMYNTTAYLFDIFWAIDFMDDKLTFKGEAFYLFGNGDLNSKGRGYNTYLDGALGVGTGPRLPDLDVTGWLVYADLTYNGDIFTVGVSGLICSGAKDYNGVAEDKFNMVGTTGTTDFGWGTVIFPGSPDYLAGFGGGFLAPLGLGALPENITSVKLHWSVCPMDKLDIHGAFIWAMYTEDVGRYARNSAGALLETSLPFVAYGHPMNYGRSSADFPGGYIPAGISKDLGWEIDVGFTYEIMEGLAFNSEFGILFTGNAFDYRDPNTMERKDWGNIYRWVNTLSYEF